MKTFEEYIKEDQKTNRDFQGLVKKASSLASKLKDKAEKVLNGLSYEKDETKKMLKTFFELLRDKLNKQSTVTEEDVLQALNQLKQNAKLAMIAPIFMLPGGTTTTTVLYLAGKKYFGISILPKGLESVFEMVKYKIHDEQMIIEKLNEEIENGKI